MNEESFFAFTKKLHPCTNFFILLCVGGVKGLRLAPPSPPPPPCCVKNFHPMKQEWETVGHPVHGWSNFWNIFFRIITFPTFGGSTNNEHVEDKLFINSYMWPHEKVCEHFVTAEKFFLRLRHCLIYLLSSLYIFMYVREAIKEYTSHIYYIVMHIIL